MKLDLTHPQHRQGDDYERRVGERLQQALPGVSIYFSSEVLSKLREFERNSPGVSVQRQTRHRRERWIRTLGPPATVARRVREATLATPAFSRWRRGSRPRALRFTEDKALFAFSGNVQDLSGGSGSVGPK
jgi:hypothetical protein